MQILTGDCEPPSMEGRGGHSRLEMDHLSSTVVTHSPLVAIGLSLNVFAVLGLVTDRQTARNWSSKTRHYALMCISHEKSVLSISHLNEAMKCHWRTHSCNEFQALTFLHTKELSLALIL